MRSIYDDIFFLGDVLTHIASGKCATAGYAFTQAVAFKTPEEKHVLVVLNENTEDAKFTIQSGDLAIDAIVPKGGIRTFEF